MKNFSGYIWNFLGNSGSQIVYLVTNLILARFLTPYDFGTIGVLSVFLTVADVLIDSGLGGSLIKEKKITNLDCSTIFVVNASISIFLYLILYFSAEYIESYFNIDGLATITRIISIVFIINGLRIVPQSLLIKNLRFKILAIINLFSVVASGLIAIATSVYGLGVYSLVLYSILRSIFIVIGCFYYAHYRISFRFSFDSLRKLYSFGLFTTLVQIIDTIYENIITLIFGKCLSVSAAGYLSQAKKLEEASSKSIASTINSVAFPILVKQMDDIPQFNIEAQSILKIVVLLLCPFIFNIALFSHEIIEILYGEEWIEAASYLSLLMIASVFIILETLTRNFIKSLGKVQALFKITIAKRILGVIILFIALYISKGVILYGYILGACIGYLSNIFIYCIIIGEKMRYIVLKHLSYIFPSLVCYILSKLLFNISGQLSSRILISFLMVVIYFITIDKIYKTNYINRITILLKRKSK